MTIKIEKSKTSPDKLVMNDVDERFDEIVLYPTEIEALRNYFQAERDAELGRWRDPENPDWVVHPDKESWDYWIQMVNERTLKGSFWRKDLAFKPTLLEDEETQSVARRYFEAHPVKQPWDDAVEGDIWVLTINGEERPFRCGGQGLYALPTGSPFRGFERAVTAGRRIWPEEEETAK